MFHRASTRRGVTVLTALLLAAGASAQTRVHSLTGNARFQVGHFLPLPITFTPAPAGAIREIPGATIRQHPVPALVLTMMGTTMMMPVTTTSTVVPGPSRVVLNPGQLAAQAAPSVVPLYLANSVFFQARTSLAAHFPASQVSFTGLGRTGAATVTFCHGSAVTAQGNPACLTGAGSVPGLLRYTRTLHQFGGPARIQYLGEVTDALVAGSPPPCSGALCLAAFARNTPPANPAVGAAFGVSATHPHLPPNPGLFQVTVATDGLIFGITPTGIGSGVANPHASFGGPWTTGMLTLSQTQFPGTPQVFVFSGGDGRNASGVGSLSLVAGGMVQNTLDGPSAARGWLNLQIGPAVAQIPLMSLYAAAVLVSLISLAGLRVLHRRRPSP